MILLIREESLLPFLSTFSYSPCIERLKSRKSAVCRETRIISIFCLFLDFPKDLIGSVLNQAINVLNCIEVEGKLSFRRTPLASKYFFIHFCELILIVISITTFYFKFY
ncbi:hypothetical protein LLB_1597 [Legionella longbeachae D-4968]|nr:hypothetical protein LLB_1597 [Legionella longbeachae D-4968]